MPTMPRMKGKATKVAYKILGTPPNIKFKRNSAQKRVNRRLNFEETTRVR